MSGPSIVDSEVLTPLVVEADPASEVGSPQIKSSELVAPELQGATSSSVEVPNPPSVTDTHLLVPVIRSSEET